MFENLIVKHMTGRTGEPVINQFSIETEEGNYFQSYRTMVAFKPIGGEVILDTNAWEYSRTTTKYLRQWLDQRGRIMDKEDYQYQNLNQENIMYAFQMMMYTWALLLSTSTGLKKKEKEGDRPSTPSDN